MKKIFTLIVAVLTATTMMAQMHGALKFAGKSSMNVATTNIDNPSDTISFEMADMTSGNITLPAMKGGMMPIPSFTISGAKFSMGDNHVVTFDDQEFEATVTANGEQKTVAGSSLSGTYNMADNSMNLKVVFKYGVMPLPMTYNITAYYIKPVANAISVVVGGEYAYRNESVTYNVRRYADEGVEKMDVEVPEYQLSGTVMGNLTLGSYTVSGLVYDEERGGFYRDYKDDGLSFHFTAEQGGVKTMDGEYNFNSSTDNNILVKYDGTKVAQIVNTFQMGAMPFPIVSTFGDGTTAIATPTAATAQGGHSVYNMAGQRVGGSAKGLVIVNGRKYIRK